MYFALQSPVRDVRGCRGMGEYPCDFADWSMEGPGAVRLDNIDQDAGQIFLASWMGCGSF
jgi:hypothetical protein